VACFAANAAANKAQETDMIGTRIKQAFARTGLIAALLGASAAGLAADAPEWPQRPLRLLVPSAPGTSSDIPARIFAQMLSQQLGQGVVVENRPGAGGVIAARTLAQARPDGYTLMMAPASTISITPSALPDKQFDPAKDLTPVGMLAYTPLAIAVKADSPITDLPELLSRARRAPDTLVMANPGVYTMAHLTTELIAKRAKAGLRAVAFSGFGGSLVAVRNGDAAALIDGVAPILAQVRGGALRILAVSSPQALPGLEQYPLLSDAVPHTTVDGWFGLFAPAGLPASVATRLTQALTTIRADSGTAAALRELGMYTREDDPASFARYVQTQSTLWGEVIAQQGAGKN
jgi:tripartite-type tricarboxylate transporter receptor subunit TctC